MHFSWYTEDIFDCVWLHHAAFFQLSCAMIRRLPQKRAEQRWRRQQFSLLSSGNLKPFWLISPKAFFAGGSGMTRRQGLLSGVRSRSAAFYQRTSPWSLSSYVSSCPKLDWVRLIFDRVKEKTNNYVQTFLFDWNGIWVPPTTNFLHELIF